MGRSRRLNFRWRSKERGSQVWKKRFLRKDASALAREGQRSGRWLDRNAAFWLDGGFRRMTGSMRASPWIKRGCISDSCTLDVDTG